MKKFIIIFGLQLGIVFQCFSNDIEKDLYDLVINEKSTKIEINKSDATVTEYYKVTLNTGKYSDQFDRIIIPYREDDKVIEFNVELFNKEGKSIRKFKPKEIEDVSTNGSNLITDHRYKVVTIEPKDFPLTIEYSYSVKTKDTYLLPSKWYLTDNNDAFVEKSKLTVSKSPDVEYSIDYHLKGNQLTRKEITPTSINFEANNIKPFKEEDFGPSLRYQFPYVLLAIHDFQIEGYSGSFKSWSSLGDFYYRLNDNLQTVSDDLINSLKPLLEGKSNEEKIKIIYDHLQSKTRYVSVQLGVGGWRSFPAEYVEKKSYGDCKALTNYTKSLLTYFDIPSYNVLIRAGASDNSTSIEYGDIAFNGFNHVILAVPNQQDTIWLECTSQTAPFNYLGSFTMDRKGLMVLPNGQSKLVNTPKSKPESDFSTTQLNFQILDDGSAKGSAVSKRSGIASEYLRSAYQFESKDDFKQLLPEIMGFVNTSFENYEVDISDDFPQATIDAKFNARSIGNKTGSRIFFYPLQFLSSKKLIPNEDERKEQIIIPFTTRTNYSIVAQLPSGYSIETIENENVNLDSKFGSYKVMFNDQNPDELNIDVELIMKRGVNEPNDVKAYNEFISSFNKSLKKVVVFKQKEN